MRAALLREVPGKLEIDEVEVCARRVPTRCCSAPSRPGSATPTSTSWRASTPTPRPRCSGHESAGIVEAVGDQVSYVQPGDHVITCLSVYCGNCEPCLTGHLSLCLGKDATRRAPGTEPRLTHGGQEAYPLLDMGSFAERMLDPRARPREDP